MCSDSVRALNLLAKQGSTSRVNVYILHIFAV